MITLKTNSTWKAGQVNILPVIGETQISEDCTIQVKTLEIAEELASIPDLDFYIVEGQEGVTTSAKSGKGSKTKETEEKTGETIAPQTETSEKLPEEPAADSIAPQVSESDKLEEKKIINNLSTEKQEKDPAEELAGLTIPKLQELAASFPKGEWGGLKKPDLVNYLVTKLEEAKTA